MPHELERCCQEIASIEDQLLAGHPDVQGLCIALMDWHQEMRLLQRGEGRQAMCRVLQKTGRQNKEWHRIEVTSI